MIAGLLLATTLHADDAGKQVLIVWNEREPEGEQLAGYYALRRGVPTNQICRISARAVETITRPEFESDVRKPIAQFMTNAGLWKQLVRSGPGLSLGQVAGVQTTDNQIRVVVLMYGVPLRIESDPSLKVAGEEKLAAAVRRNEASVESELALLPSPSLPVIGPLRNPIFNGQAAFNNNEMMLVGRLDGPDPSTVRRMIDDALTAEKLGLKGRAYFDARSIKDPGYIEGDKWILSAAEMCRKAGFDCEVDEKPETFAEDHPMPNPAIYAGWYAEHVCGPFKKKDFLFMTGAVAYHLHSASGASVRTRTNYWVGPLLAHGAAATMGNVYEPYLTLTPHVDIFFERLLAGATFIEAGYASVPVLSWQTTFVGDPLYRPFKPRR